MCVCVLFSEWLVHAKPRVFKYMHRTACCQSLESASASGVPRSETRRSVSVGGERQGCLFQHAVCIVQVVLLV